MRSRPRVIIAVLAAALVATVIISLGVGRYPVRLPTVIRILGALATGGPTTAAGGWTDTEWIVVGTVRLPRVILTLLAGFGLGLSGATLQGLFRNPLVGPQVIGVSSGAALGGVLAILLSFSPSGIVGSAFLFGMLALAAVFALSRLGGSASLLSLVLGGVIVSSFCSALVGVGEMLATPEHQLPGIVYWLLGSFATASTDSVAVAGIPIAIASGVLLLLRWRINLLSLGDTDAAALGVPVNRLRWGILALVSLIVAAQVSVSGSVGWVGLVVPHLARQVVGPDHRYLLPASALLGATYLLGVDDLARTLTAQEIPVGVLTALIGTPVFAVVFWRAQSRGWARE